EVLDEGALGAVATAAILVDHHVAVPDEVRRHLSARLRPRVARAALGAADLGLAVGRALQDHREGAVHGAAVPGGAVYVAGEAHAVAHRRHNVALCHGVEALSGRRRGAAGGAAAVACHARILRADGRAPA